MMENDKPWIKTETPPKRTVKDSVFTDLFSIPKYSLLMAKTLNPDIELVEKDIEMVSLHSIFLKQQYNDLGMLAKDKLLICCEAQSTWSVNILVRMFMYLAETYHRYLKNRDEINLYGSKKVKLPKPKCYVIYTGENKSYPDVLSLSEEFFESDSVLDLKIKVFSNEGKDNIIEEYIRFCHVFNEQIKIHGQTKKAIEETIKICQNENVLRDYLEKRKKEVFDIMSILFSQEEATRRYGYEQYNEGVSHGISQGISQGCEKTALNMLRAKMNINQIAECTELPLARIKELALEVRNA